jgi:hypothetical protein
MSKERLISVGEMARNLDVTPELVRARAKMRKVGRLVGKIRVFTPDDIPKMQPGKPGNFRKKAD